MQGPSREHAEQLESALLYLGRSLPGLARALRTLLPAARLEQLGKAAGRRRSGAAEAGAVVADGLVQQPKFRRQVVDALLDELPESPALPEAMFEDGLHQSLRPAALRAELRRDLCSPEQAGWELAEARIEAWAELLEPEPTAATPAPAAPPAKAAKADKAARERVRKLEQDKHGLQDRLKVSNREIARLQDELGREHHRREALREELTDCRSRATDAETRATEAKKRLKESESPSDRELHLIRDAEEASSRLHVLEQKFGIISEERDDLRACLEDHDRFSKVVEEELPSFRDRPLTQEENQLAAVLAAREQAGQAPFRVLVVGGGEPQHRHQDKFEEYVEVLGIRGRWRMAEYTSWHKEIDHLARDMDRNYDALVVLHWNRTTFTRRARDICNQQGQKPCLTCHYEGFVALRQTLQECLRQLLARES